MKCVKHSENAILYSEALSYRKYIGILFIFGTFQPLLFCDFICVHGEPDSKPIKINGLTFSGTEVLN